jgi:prepilin-type N-terminal cleavage/methylation domain-containing protein
MRATLRRRGFTLIEVLISLGIFAVVSFLLMEMLARQSRTYTVVDNVAETQEKARAVANLLEQEVRATSFLTPVGAALCGYDTRPNNPDGDPDVLYVTNTEALTPPPPPGMPQPSNFQRSVSLSGALPANVGGTATQTFTLSSLVVDAPAFYDLNGDGVGDSDFRGPTAGAPGGGVILFDPGDATKGTACGQITAVNLATNTISVDFTSGGSVPTLGGVTGTPLGAGYTSLAFVPAHGYWINVLNGTPRLMRDGVVMAEDVEDLQLAAFFDAGLDGVIGALPSTTPPPWNDANEYPGSDAPNSWYVSGARDNRELREIRVTIVARTRAWDPDAAANPAFANNFPQSPENRVVAAAADGFRRRVITLTITPRNVVSKM